MSRLVEDFDDSILYAVVFTMNAPLHQTKPNLPVHLTKYKIHGANYGNRVGKQVPS